MVEIWKDIPGFPGYQVSNLGNVRSLDRYKVKWNRYKNVRTLLKGRNLKKHILRDYYAVCLWQNGKMYNKQIHRLVAISFLDNKQNLPCINHIDGNKLNNNVSNLEWCSYSYNTKEAYRLGLKKVSQKMLENVKKLGLSSGKKVVQKDFEGNIIKTFNSGREASIKTGINQGNISLCCNGKRKSIGGYLWEYI